MTNKINRTQEEISKYLEKIRNCIYPLTLSIFLEIDEVKADRMIRYYRHRTGDKAHNYVDGINFFGFYQSEESDEFIFN